MSSDKISPTSAVDDGRSMSNRVQIQAAHPLHHHQNHPLAFINSMDTLQRHFMISLQEFSDPSSMISTLLFRSTGFFQCAACSSATPGGPSFHCLTCPFSISAALPLIAVDHHPHPLLLLDRNSDHKNLICCVCEEGISFPTFVRCVHCDAFLHVQCALPHDIKVDQHHNHRILLTPSSEVVGRYNCFCGVCGEQTDGVSWVYCCELCTFVAHIACVIYHHQIPSETESETSITTQLCGLALDDEHLEPYHNHEKEELEEEGSSHESIIMKPGVTLQQILDSFSEFDDADYQGLVNAMVQDVGGDDDDDDDDENETSSEDKHLNHFPYLEKVLYDHLDRIELGDDAANPFEDFERDSPTILVEDRYLISQNFADTFTRIFAKHGDISERLSLSMKVKTIVWNLFCKVVDDMSKTEFEKTTGELLVSWMIGIRGIQVAGFEVGFAFEGWKKIAMAYFGAKAKVITQELVVEMEHKIEQQKLKLQNLIQQRDELLSLKEKCLVQALAMDGKFAGHELI